MVSAPQTQASSTRIESLDTLRFVAALAVLLSHARAMWPWEFLDPVIRCGMFNPKSAVTFFFVLSGFVLHLNWKGAAPTWRSYSSFVTRRAFRIYPLYYVSLALAFAVLFLLPLAGCPAFSTDAAGSEVLLRDRHDIVQWIHHGLLITPGLDMQFLNPPIWTLAAEMRVALIFPWLSWLCRCLSWRRSLIFIPIFFAVAPWVSQKTLPTFALIPLFFLGAWLAEHRDRFQAMYAARAWLMLVAGLIVYSLAADLRGRDFMSQIWQMDAAGAGSACIMLAVLRLPLLRSVLSQRAMVIGGQASYGLYVLHFPLLMALAYVTWKFTLPAWQFQVAAVAATVLLAVPLYRCLELPMISLGRRVAKKLF